MQIKKLEPAELLTSLQIDEKYDGLYVGVQRTEKLFSEGLGYVVAVGDKTDAIFDELIEYNRSLSKTNGMRGTVVAGNRHREDDALYVTFNNVQ